MTAGENKDPTGLGPDYGVSVCANEAAWLESPTHLLIFPKAPRLERTVCRVH